METICCDLHLNHLVEMVQMRGHNICFYAELIKGISNYHQILLSRTLDHIYKKKHFYFDDQKNPPCYYDSLFSVKSRKIL